jgi:hypothetical protein
MKHDQESLKKRYESNAQRQRAYRLRNKHLRPPTEAEIIRAARKLNEAIGIAALEGD